MKRRTVLTLAAGALAAAATTAPARADDVVTLAYGQKGAFDSMIPQQGIDQGLFKKENLEVRVSYTAGGPDTIEAAATGSTNFGFGIGTTAAIAAFAKGAPIKIVSAEFTGGSDLYFYARADSPINSFADLNGKSIGFTRPGSSSYMMERALATQFKVEPNFVSTGEMPATLTQVMSGQIDAGWASVPNNFELVGQKKIKIIAHGSDAKVLANQTIRVNVANTAFLRDHRDLGVRFFRAYAATREWLYKNMNQALANFARYNGITVDEARQIVPYFPAKALTLATVANFEQSMKDALDYKFISAPLTADQQKAIFDILAPR
jgi:NitT/TauT family transport system substrate-binding protein